MRGAHDNKLMSSFSLWFDHTLSHTGEAYKNAAITFYPQSRSPYNGFYTYSSPYKGLVSDSSIGGASVPTGVYLGNSFIGLGVSGLTGINYEEGQVYFTGQLNTNPTGYFAVKEFNVCLTNKSEQELLFETKHSLKPKINQSITGLKQEETTYPIIYLKNIGGTNEPWAFGGTDENISHIRALILADSEFNLTAVQSIFKDTVRQNLPLFDLAEMPFNALGSPISGRYNYINKASGRYTLSSSAWIKRVFVEELPIEIKKLNPGVFTSMIDFEVCTYR